MVEVGGAGSEAQKASTPQPLARVGAGVIGATQRSLSELREERDKLRALVEAGGASELDPTQIDPSPFPDRLPDDNEADFEAFKKLILDEGQKVPIQVRRHPTEEGRYQVVYGHRRWRAASDLGIKVKAIILALTDSELVVAQGIENAARQDLSWIERALFASRMDAAGIRARDIRAALSIDDPELARLRSVCRALPADVIETIGRAPKVGRPRWVSLAAMIGEDPSGLARVRRALSDDKVLGLPSDDRFRCAMSALRTTVEPSRSAVEIRTPQGRVVGKVAFSDRDIKLSISAEHAESFRVFVEGELPELLQRFFTQEGEG